MTAGPAFRATLLVVDDNVSLADNLSEILRDEGYAAKTATRCAEALRIAETEFDVALVDLRLPDGNGAELAQQLTERWPDSEVILLTGFATVESAAAAVRAGACAYLMKPCATPELLLTVEQALRKVRLHREKRELARRAQVAEKLAAVGTLTAGLSHEIRNPLNAAGLQLSVLERRISRLAPELIAPLMEPLSLVRDEIQRLDHTLEDFLQFARPQELVREPVSVDGMLARVADLLAGDAAQRDVRLERRLEPGVFVAGDENRLRQVLMNLVLNALDAAPQGGRVELGTGYAPGGVAVWVEDDGPGIPAAIRERIFEPFFTTKPSGSGLGLPIVHAIVTQHGGTITLAPSAAGTRFELTLPALTPGPHTF